MSRQPNSTRLPRDVSERVTDSGPQTTKNLAEKMAEEMLKQKNVESVLFGGKKISELTNLEKLDSFAAELVLEHHRRSSHRTPAAAAPRS